ncbi:MAG: RnfABCDGE type electron transport complex subunit D [Candidatus Latescibacteria bacterium]|nr:RnfABCDGE type electron transport complex subunit D [Candidatus Latescibacterota bacterium]
MARLFKVSATPHLRDATNIPTIMYSVVVALIPALIGAIYFFGLPALWITLLTVFSCVIAEGIIEKMSGKPLTIWDGSAIVTGILLAFNLSPGVSWWIPVVGGIFAIVVGKMTFGGLGYNPLNPALLGRVFLQQSWPVEMNASWTLPRGIPAIDAETIATPLTILKENIAVLKSSNALSDNIDAVINASGRLGDLQVSYMDMFVGRIPGCLGETSVMLLLIGAAFLLYKRYIGWRIPFSFVGTVGLLTWIFGGYEGFFTGPWLFHILSGGLIIGAFFMATDMVTSPITKNGRFVFGIGCGLLTTIIRLIGGYPEGVSYAILLMNLTVPLINRYTQPKVFGEVKNRV